MNKKVLLLLSTFLIIFWGSLSAQEVKLPLEIKSGHLNSVWKINDSIDAKVFLETGFPKIIVNESFALKNLQSVVQMEKASEDTYIALWGGKNKFKVSYVIKDSLLINGKKEEFDAFVVDLSKIRAWKDFDVIYPLRDLSGAVEINIKDNYIVLDKDVKELTSDFIEFDAKADNKTKGLYITTSLQVYDTLNTKEELRGNFLFDLGAANAVFVNRNLPEVEEFVSKSDRVVLKDTTKFTPNKRTKLAILMPDKIQLANVVLRKNFIVAMKMYKSKTSSQYVGMIGNKFFVNFIVVFDFNKNKVYMKPNSDIVEILR